MAAQVWLVRRGHTRWNAGQRRRVTNRLIDHRAPSKPPSLAPFAGRTDRHAPIPREVCASVRSGMLGGHHPSLFGWWHPRPSPEALIGWEGMSQQSKTSARVRALAVALGALGVSMGLASGTFGIINWASFHSLPALDLPSVVVPISFGVLGALVASREPRNTTGWLFIFIAVVGGPQGVGGGYALSRWWPTLGSPAGSGRYGWTAGR